MLPTDIAKPVEERESLIYILNVLGERQEAAMDLALLILGIISGAAVESKHETKNIECIKDHAEMLMEQSIDLVNVLNRVVIELRGNTPVNG